MTVRVEKKFSTFGTNIITFLAALVPVFKSCPPCPLCMPKYAAILSLFGLKLADYSQYLIPVMLVSLAISIGTIGYQTHKRKLKKFPFFGALTSAICILTFKYVIGFTWGTYAGMIGLFTSTVMHHRSVHQNQSAKKSCSTSCCKGHN